MMPVETTLLLFITLAIGVFVGVAGVLIFQRPIARSLPAPLPLSQALYRAYLVAWPVGTRGSLPETLAACPPEAQSAWLAVAQCALRRLGTVVLLCWLASGLGGCGPSAAQYRATTPPLNSATEALRAYPKAIEDYQRSLFDETTPPAVIDERLKIARGAQALATPVIKALQEALRRALDVCHAQPQTEVSHDR